MVFLNAVNHLVGHQRRSLHLMPLKIKHISSLSSSFSLLYKQTKNVHQQGVIRKNNLMNVNNKLIGNELQKRFYSCKPCNLSQQKWITNEAQSFTKENFYLLLDNKIPCIRIPKFLSVEECQNTIKASEAVGFDFYKNVTPPIGKIGITQFEHFKKEKQIYFDKVKLAKLKRDTVYNVGGVNLLKKVMSSLSEELEEEVDIAKEPQYGDYFAGLIRQISTAYLHFDFAQYDAPGWFIQQIENQLSWNIYFGTPKEGGELVVYNQPWQPNIFEQFQLPGHSGSYGFNNYFVKERQYFTIKPDAGDLWIFNTRNFHEVLPSDGRRYTNSSFIGQLKNGKFILWS